MPLGSGTAYTAPTAHEQIGTGNLVSIANGNLANLPWDGGSNGPDTLLDRSVAATPTVLVAGVYAVAVVAAVNGAMTAGGWWALTLTLDTGTPRLVVFNHAQATTVDTAPQTSLSASRYLPAGGQITAAVSNNDGVSSRTFFLTACTVQRLS